MFDGEGCIAIDSARNHSLQVLLSMTDKEPIEFIVSILPAKIRTQQIKSGRTIYEISYGGNTALDFLRAIQPYVKGKKEQVKVALTYPTQRRGSGSVAASDRVYFNDILAERKQVADELVYHKQRICL